MVRRLLIRNAMVVCPKAAVKTNVLIDNGIIASIDAPSTSQVDEVLDAEGLLLFPGLVDDQVHFREPGLTHKEDLLTASYACVAGGVTSFLEMPNTKPAAINQELIEQKYQIASTKSIANYGFYIGATAHNVADLKRATGVPGIKIFIGSSTGDLLVDEQDALERIFAETTLPICAHCEDETTVLANAAAIGEAATVADHSRIRDHRAAWISTKRTIDLAHRHSHRFHVLHLSTAAELELVTDHRNLITCELCPHHWEFCVDDYARLGSLIQMNPSIKNREDTVGLWNGLVAGKIQVVATDHAPHTLEEKRQPYPKSPSDAPARVWGIVGKGRIEVGYDADLVLVDPNMDRTITNENQFTKSKWSPWAGRTLRGWPVKTWVGGHLAFDSGRIVAEKPASRLQFDPSLGGYWATEHGTGTLSKK